jgi:hypothetical protein
LLHHALFIFIAFQTRASYYTFSKFIVEKVRIELTSLVFQTNALTNSAIFPYFAESRRIELHSLVNYLFSKQYPAQQDLLSIIFVGKVRIEPQRRPHTRLKATILQTAPLPLTDYFPLLFCKHDGIRTHT